MATWLLAWSWGLIFLEIFPISGSALDVRSRSGVLGDLLQAQQLQDSAIPPPFLPLLEPQDTEMFCARFALVPWCQILGKTGKFRCQCGSEAASKPAQGKADLKPLHDESGRFLFSKTFLKTPISDMKTFLSESFLVNKKG